MPELRMRFTWPDGVPGECYSPSRVITAHFSVDSRLPVPEFVARARVALAAASERVRVARGFPCALAMGALARIESEAARFAAGEQAPVTILAFERLS